MGNTQYPHKLLNFCKEVYFLVLMRAMDVSYLCNNRANKQKKTMFRMGPVFSLRRKVPDCVFIMILAHKEENIGASF